MARGIGAAIFIIALTFSMTILAGVGYYSAMGVSVDVEGQNEDVQQAAEQLDGISFAGGRSSSILEGPLAVVTPVVGLFQTIGAVLGNTSGLIQLLYGMPKVVGDTVELMFRVALLITMGYLIRSGSPY